MVAGAEILRYAVGGSGKTYHRKLAPSEQRRSEDLLGGVACLCARYFIGVALPTFVVCFPGMSSPR
jgi:hypothetical protein